MNYNSIEIEDSNVEFYFPYGGDQTNTVGTTALDPHPSCHDLADYVNTTEGLFEALPQPLLDAIDGTNAVGDEEMTATDMQDVSRAYALLATANEDLPGDAVPYAAGPYHEAMIEVLTAGAELYLAMATGGQADIEDAAQSAEMAVGRLEDAVSFGEQQCGDLWYERMDNGS